MTIVNSKLGNGFVIRNADSTKDQEHYFYGAKKHIEISLVASVASSSFYRVTSSADGVAFDGYEFYDVHVAPVTSNVFVVGKNDLNRWVVLGSYDQGMTYNILETYTSASSVSGFANGVFTDTSGNILVSGYNSSSIDGRERCEVRKYTAESGSWTTVFKEPDGKGSRVSVSGSSRIGVGLYDDSFACVVGDRHSAAGSASFCAVSTDHGDTWTKVYDTQYNSANGLPHRIRWLNLSVSGISGSRISFGGTGLTSSINPNSQVMRFATYNRGDPLSNISGVFSTTINWQWSGINHTIGALGGITAATVGGLRLIAGNASHTSSPAATLRAGADEDNAADIGNQQIVGFNPSGSWEVLSVQGYEPGGFNQFSGRYVVAVRPINSNIGCYVRKRAIGANTWTDIAPMSATRYDTAGTVIFALNNNSGGGFKYGTTFGGFVSDFELQPTGEIYAVGRLSSSVSPIGHLSASIGVIDRFKAEAESVSGSTPFALPPGKSFLCTMAPRLGNNNNITLSSEQWNVLFHSASLHATDLGGLLGQKKININFDRVISAQPPITFSMVVRTGSVNTVVLSQNDFGGLEIGDEQSNFYSVNDFTFSSSINFTLLSGTHLPLIKVRNMMSAATLFVDSLQMSFLLPITDSGVEYLKNVENQNLETSYFAPSSLKKVE